MGELFSAFGINVSLLIAQMVNFGILFAALWYFLYKQVMQMIDTRREKIEKGVEDAEKAEVRLNEIEGERDDILKDASHNAEEILTNSKARADEQASGIVSGANERADSILASANARADEMKAQAMRESDAAITKAAILAAEKIMREKQS